MSVHTPDLRLRNRGVNWRWWVCGLLLLATMINYMDRLTLNQMQVAILLDLGLHEGHYGWVEGMFGLAFAVGALVFGLIVDRWNVFWIYPLALVGWCIAGFITGFATGFWSLLMFRMLLGFFEAANWPCALRATQHILPPNERSMGNSILQSGAAVGAILIPLVLWMLVPERSLSEPEQVWSQQMWRFPFMIVGTGGLGWVVLWMVILRPADLRLHATPAGVAAEKSDGPPALPRAVFLRRFCVLVVLVVSINMTWHFLRSWLPSFLMKQHGFKQNEANFFSTAYYIFTDAGALAAGYATLRLARHGVGVHASRRLVFLVGAVLAALCMIVPFLPPIRWLLIGVLLVIGFGSLGMFPCYYSFSQDLTVRGQGKVTGALGACCWGAMALWQIAIGQWVHSTKSYALPFFIAGVLPLCAFGVLLFVWGTTRELAKTEAPPPAPVPETTDTRIAAAEVSVALEAAGIKGG